MSLYNDTSERAKNFSSVCNSMTLKEFFLSNNTFNQKSVTVSTTGGYCRTEKFIFKSPHPEFFLRSQSHGMSKERKSWNSTNLCLAEYMKKSSNLPDQSNDLSSCINCCLFQHFSIRTQDDFFPVNFINGQRHFIFMHSSWTIHENPIYEYCS